MEKRLIFFSMISGEPDTVRKAFERTRERIEAAVPFVDGTKHQHLASTGRWAVVAYGSPDPLADQRLIMLPSGCVVINGPLLSFDGHKGQAAITAVAQALSSEPIESVYERMAGSFAVGGYLQRHGHFGFSDFSGITPNYWASADGLTVVGNKPSVVGLALPAIRQDRQALSWLVGHANVFGSATPVQGVEQIEPETLISARHGQKAWRGSLPSVWPDRSEHLVDDLTTAEWDEITEHLVSNTRDSLSYFDNPSLALTGGKDSRLVLALTCAASDLQSIETFTNGHRDNPDVETAEFIAKQIGVKHRVNVPSQAAASAAAKVWDLLPLHTARFDGLICPWDGLTPDLRGTSMAFTGFGGELYRGSHAKAMVKKPLATIGEAQVAWRDYHQPFDPLGILRGGYVSYQHEWVAEWVGQNPSHLSVLPEKFYVENRLGRSSGPLMQNTPGRIKIAPLLSMKAARLFFKLSKAPRVGEVLNYEVMRRTKPELNMIPFLKQTWSPEVMKRNADLPKTSYQTISAATSKSVAPRQFDFVSHEADNIQEYLRKAAAQTDIDSILDVDRAVKAIRDPAEMSVTVKAKAIFSSLAIAHRLLGDTVMPRDRPS